MSSDGASLYDDGHIYCFGQCGGKDFQPKEGGCVEKPAETPVNDGSTLQYYPARGISTATREFLTIVTRLAASGEPVEDIVTFPNGTKQI